MVQLNSRYGLWGGYELYLKTTILESVYPVGSVYISLTDSRNPGDILGFGTWEALPAGYSIVAQGTATAEDGSTLKFTAGQKSGEFKHQTSIGELPERVVVSLNSGSVTIQSVPWGATDKTEWGATSLYDYSKAGVNEGNYNKYHNNISPAIAAYMWKRTE